MTAGPGQVRHSWIAATGNRPDAAFHVALLPGTFPSALAPGNAILIMILLGGAAAEGPGWHCDAAPPASKETEEAMPQYDYKCQSCKRRFTVKLSISEYVEQDRKHKIQCPKCNSTEVRHLIESVFVTTSKKS